MLKDTVRWHSGPSWPCATVTSASFQDIFVTPKGDLSPLSSHSPLPQEMVFKCQTIVYSIISLMFSENLHAPPWVPTHL